jgi:single-strand DNA-binding protein
LEGEKTMNHVTLIGRLTKDVETRYTQSGKPVATFTLAIDRIGKGANGEKQADYIPCVVWDKQAEVAGKYLVKGRQTAVEGRIQTRTYDAQDGTKKYVTEVVVSHLELIGNRDGGRQAAPSAGDYPTDEEVPF